MTLRQQEEVREVDYLAKAKELLNRHESNAAPYANMPERATAYATIAVAEELRAAREPKREWPVFPMAYALVRTLNGIREVHSIYLDQDQAMTEAVSLNDMAKKQMESTNIEVSWSVTPHTLKVAGPYG